MLGMEYVFVDVLNVDQLMIDDLIEVEGDIVKVIAITSLPNGFAIGYEDDFGEKELLEVDDYAQFNLYVLRDE